MSEEYAGKIRVDDRGIVAFDLVSAEVKPTKYAVTIPASAWHGDPIRIEIEPCEDLWTWQIDTPVLYGDFAGTPATTARQAMDIARRAFRFWAEAIDEELARIDGKEEEASE